MPWGNGDAQVWCDGVGLSTLTQKRVTYYFDTTSLSALRASVEAAPDVDVEVVVDYDDGLHMEYWVPLTDEEQLLVNSRFAALDAKMANRTAGIEEQEQLELVRLMRKYGVYDLTGKTCVALVSDGGVKWRECLWCGGNDKEDYQELVHLSSCQWVKANPLI